MDEIEIGLKKIKLKIKTQNIHLISIKNDILYIFIIEKI